MVAFHQKLPTTTYSAAASFDQLQECWKIVKLMLRVFLRQLPKARVGADTACNAADLNVRVGQYLWHTLQAHRVMDAFHAASFHRRPEVFPSIVNHLFEHRAPKVAVDNLKAKVNAQDEVIKQQVTIIMTLTAAVNQLKAKVAKIK